LAEHRHDREVGRLVGDRGLLVAVEGALLALPLIGQRFDQFPDQSRQVALGVGRVLPLDYMLGDEGKVVSDEDT